MKIASIITISLAIILIWSCGSKSTSRDLKSHIDPLPSFEIDTAQQPFHQFYPENITQITIMNCQFDKDTFLTNRNCKRHLTQKQIDLFCSILNDQMKVDTLLDSYKQYTDFVITISSENQKTDPSLLYFHRSGLVTNWDTWSNKCGYKKWPDAKVLQKFWDNAIQPPIFAP